MAMSRTHWSGKAFLWYREIIIQMLLTIELQLKLMLAETINQSFLFPDDCSPTVTSLSKINCI